MLKRLSFIVGLLLFSSVAGASDIVQEGEVRINMTSVAQRSSEEQLLPSEDCRVPMVRSGISSTHYYLALSGPVLFLGNGLFYSGHTYAGILVKIVGFYMALRAGSPFAEAQGYSTDKDDIYAVTQEKKNQ
jgi:hypothetical protein